MHFPRLKIYALVAAICSILFASSAAWGAPLVVRGPALQARPAVMTNFGSPPNGRAFANHAKGAQLLYLADRIFNQVGVFAQPNLKNIATLGGSNGVDEPNGIYVTPTGDLLVTSNLGYVMAYHEAALHPYMMWYNGTGSPALYVASCGPTVYATESGTNLVRKYNAHSNGPVGTLHDSNLTSIYGIATDSKCDIFVDGITSGSQVAVDYFPHGNSNATNLQNLGYDYSGAWPGSLAVDPKGDLLVDNENYGYICYFCNSTILTYAPPWTGSATSTANFLGQFASFALSSDATSIWEDDLNPYGYYGYYYCYYLTVNFGLGGGSSFNNSLGYYYDGCSNALLGVATSPRSKIGP